MWQLPSRRVTGKHYNFADNVCPDQADEKKEKSGDKQRHIRTVNINFPTPMVLLTSSNLTQFIINIFPTLLCQQLIGNNINTTLLAGFLCLSAILLNVLTTNEWRCDVNESCDVWSKQKQKRLRCIWIRIRSSLVWEYEVSLQLGWLYQLWTPTWQIGINSVFN